MLVICSTLMIFIRLSSLSFDDLSLEAFYGKFRSICEEIDLSEPISLDISEMMQQHKSMQVTRSLSSLLSSFDGVRPHIL